MKSLVGAVIGSLIVLLGMAVGCSDSAAQACDTTEDCYAGDICHGQICVPQSEVNGSGAGHDAGGDDDASTTGSNGATNGDAATGADAGEADGSSTSNGDGGGGGQTCSFSESGEHSCYSGHESLEDNNVLDLRPDELDGVGCTAADANSASGFESFEEESWVIRSCPEARHRLRFGLQRCYDETYPAFVRIEPVDDVCPLDGPFVDVWIAREGNSDFEQCTDVGRDHDCYFEEALEDGGFEWVIKVKNTTVVSGYDWVVDIYVEAELDAYFEYQVTAWVPPHPPTD